MQIQQSKVIISSGSIVIITIPASQLTNKRLIEIEAVELTSATKMAYDIVTIALAIPNTAGIDLKIGHIGIGGSMRWHGDKKVPEGADLVVAFAYPASGNTCYMRWSTAEPDEVTGHEGDSVNVVQTFPLGRPKIISFDGVADALSLNVRPAENFAWAVVWLAGYHDDPTARTLTWIDTDGTLTASQIGSSRATSVYQIYGLIQGINTNFTQNSRQITYINYPQLTVDALAAGKKIFARGLAFEYAIGGQ